MSGSTIGSVVGAGIGWMVGGPAGAQWGWMIGGAVGAIVDPQKFETPRIDDFNFQSSQDGVPRVYGYGTYPVDQTWLMWRSEPRHVRKKKSAKGGPTQVTNTYYISYAIAVGDGGISGFKLIEEDGKVVFDARTDDELSALGYTAEQISETRAAQAKFLQNVTMYYGAPDQMPDPTMVAVEGAGNVPAYRDTAYFVVKDKDITQRQSIPRYRVVVANCGERHEDNIQPAYILVTGDSLEEGGPLAAYATAAEVPEFTPIPRSSGLDVSGIPGYYADENARRWVVASYHTARVAPDLETWETIPCDLRSLGEPVGGPGGWLLNGDDGPEAFDHVAVAAHPPESFDVYRFTTEGAYVSPHGEEAYATGAAGGDYYMDVDYRGVLVRTAVLSGSPLLAVAHRPDGIAAFNDFAWWNGSLIANVSMFGNVHQIRRSPDRGATWPEILLSVEGETIIPGQLAASDTHLVCLSALSQYVWTSEDGFATRRATGLQRGSHAAGRQIKYTAGRFFIVGRVDFSDTEVRVVSTVNGITFSGFATVPIRSYRGLAVSDPAADAGLVAIPDSPGYYIDPATGDIIGPPGVSIDVCQPTLGEIVAARCENRSVPRDVSELTDLVTGYRVAEPTTDQRIIQGLQPGYFFGASEFDGVLHFPKRGRPLTFALTEADFIERDGDPIQWERTQETELLRKVTLAYLDPSVNYTRTTQDWERNATTIQAEGESTVELGITGSKDWAKQVAHKSVKVAWGEPDKATVHVSIARADLVTGAEGTAPYLDGSTVAVRIESIKDEGLVRMLELRRTRAGLYESNATGASKPLPAFPGSNIRGPTDGIVGNWPVLVDANDVPGIHWAAAGFTSAWAGAQFQILRAGEWVVAGETTFAANTGTLLAPLPYHAGDVDTANVLHLRMGDDLESVTFTQLLQERNPIAILRPDGTAEIVQPQTCVEVAPGEFDCTAILRNRLDSGASAHAAGARVVFLDEAVEYASLEPTDIGQTLSYRFVSLGTDPDAAPVQTLDLTTMESQREWPVAGLSVAADGDDYTLTWQPRHRLGSDVFPVRSTNWAGYEVSYNHSGGSGSVTVTTESHTFTLPGASDITFSVAQVNQFTGAGPAQTVEIP